MFRLHFKIAVLTFSLLVICFSTSHSQEDFESQFQFEPVKAAGEKSAGPTISAPQSNGLFEPVQEEGQSDVAGEEIANAKAAEDTAATGDKYSIDMSHTSVVFAVQHFGLSFTYGRFNEVEGSFSLESGELTSAGFDFTVKAASIDTNSADRDKHLRGPDFFDTDQFPEITFKTKEVKKNEDGSLDVVGDFTMLGVTKPLTMPMRVVGVGLGPFGKQRAGYFTKFELKRSDFGMDKMLGQIGDRISITFSFEGLRSE